MTSIQILLAKAGAVLLLLLGVFAYAQHRQKAVDEASLAKLRVAQAEAIANEQAKAHGLEIQAQAEVAHQRDVYEAKLQESADIVSRERAAVSQLRDKLAAFARGTGVSSAAGVPVPDADARAVTLAGVASTLAESGSVPAESARACALKLEAAEAWAAAVIKEASK
jgi:hypothetical protein